MKRGISLLLCLLLAVGMLCAATGCGEEDSPRKARKETSAHSDKKNESGKVKEAQDACKTYYEGHFEKDTDIALCADVTGDEIPELIVVRYTMETEGAIEGTVYTLSGKEMKLIYTKRGGYYQNAFSWYLMPHGENSFYLAEEIHKMSTGIGTVKTRVYQLDNEGKETEIDCIVFTTDDWDNLEKRENGDWQIKQSAWDAYVDDVQKMVKGGYILYSNASNCDLLKFLSHLDNSFYLSKARELSDPPPSLKHNDTVSEVEEPDMPEVTPASSKKPTSPVDRPHVDTVDAAFWRDAEPAIKAWKQWENNGCTCEFGGGDSGEAELRSNAESWLNGDDLARFNQRLQEPYGTILTSTCCHSYQEVEEQDRQFFSDRFMKNNRSGDNALTGKNSIVFEGNGKIFSMPDEDIQQSYINTSIPTFDFSDPDRPVVIIYRPRLDDFCSGEEIFFYSMSFVKEDGRYKLDNVETGSKNFPFAQLEEDLGEYVTCTQLNAATALNVVYEGSSRGFYENKVPWLVIPINGNGTDTALVNLSTGEVREAISGSDAFSWDNYTFVGESWYVPISW